MNLAVGARVFCPHPSTTCEVPPSTVKFHLVLTLAYCHSNEVYFLYFKWREKVAEQVGKKWIL